MASSKAAPATAREPSPPLASAVDDDALEAFPARAVGGAGGGVPTWVWAAVGVAAVAALVVTAAAMMGDEPLDEAPHAQRDGTDGVEAPIDPSAAAPVDRADESAAQDERPEPAAAPVEEPAVEPVVLTLTGVPEGATVTLDGEAVSGTELELPPADGERALVVQLAGHQEYRRSVPADRSVEVAVELRAEARPEPRRPRVRPSGARPARARPARPPRRARPARPAGRRSGRPVAISDPGF